LAGAPAALQAGYAVIFLSRKGSAQPFVSDFQEDLSAQTLTDFFKLGPGGQLAVNGGVEAGLAQAVRRASRVAEQGTYLNVPFSTLFEYLRVRSKGWSMLLVVASACSGGLLLVRVFGGCKVRLLATSVEQGQRRERSISRASQPSAPASCVSNGLHRSVGSLSMFLPDT
jgi:hypothetical protein